MKRFLCWVSMLLSLVISSVQAADIQGLWKIAISSNNEAEWIIGLNNGIIYGSSYWYGTKVFTDKLSGTVNGDQVSIIRDLPAPYLGETQIYSGTITGTNVSGTCSGTGLNSSCVWTATITPLVTSIVTPPPECPIDCPAPPTCPIECPVPPVCPTPITGECIATYNADTGRFTAPCVAVPVIEPFVGKKTLNYSIEMQQRTGVYTFDLDLNTVKQR